MERKISRNTVPSITPVCGRPNLIAVLAARVRYHSHVWYVGNNVFRAARYSAKYVVTWCGKLNARYVAFEMPSDMHQFGPP